MPEEAECCVLSICCDAQLRRAALATMLINEAVKRHQAISTELAALLADFILDTYDLAPHGLLTPLIEYVAAEAREYPYRKA